MWLLYGPNQFWAYNLNIPALSSINRSKTNSCTCISIIETQNLLKCVNLLFLFISTTFLKIDVFHLELHIKSSHRKIKLCRHKQLTCFIFFYISMNKKHWFNSRLHNYSDWNHAFVDLLVFKIVISFLARPRTCLIRNKLNVYFQRFVFLIVVV